MAHIIQNRVELLKAIRSYQYEHNGNWSLDYAKNIIEMLISIGLIYFVNGTLYYDDQHKKQGGD